MSRDISDVRVDSSRANYILSFLGALGGILLFAIIVLVAYAPNRAPSINKQQAGVRAERLRELRSKDIEELSTYSVLDKEAGKVRLPIERAMELTARDLGKRSN